MLSPSICRFVVVAWQIIRTMMSYESWHVYMSFMWSVLTNGWKSMPHVPSVSRRLERAAEPCQAETPASNRVRNRGKLIDMYMKGQTWQDSIILRWLRLSQVSNRDMCFGLSVNIAYSSKYKGDYGEFPPTLLDIHRASATAKKKKSYISCTCPSSNVVSWERFW